MSTALPLLGAPGSFSELEESFAALQTWLGGLNSSIAALSAQIAGGGQAIFGLALTDVPTTLGTGDAGSLYYVTDYAHFVRWTGSAFVFMDGGNRFFADHHVAPSTGWALCDGSTVTYMTVGTVLGTGTFATPNLSGSPAYKKSGAAYAGIAAASGSTGTGTTGTGGVDHTHTYSTTTSTPTGTQTYTSGLVPAADDGHTHTVSGTTSGASVVDHTHSVPALAVGTIEMARLTVLPYYRL